MKNKSIIKNIIDKLSNGVHDIYNECEEIDIYNQAKKSEITELDFILREGPYYGHNIQDVIDINPSYLLWYHREGVLKFNPYIICKIHDANYGIV